MKLADVNITELGKTQNQRKGGAGGKVEPACEFKIDEEFEIKKLSEEEIEASRQKAEEAKRLAMSLGKQEVTVRTTLNDLLLKTPDWKLLGSNDKVRQEIERLQSRLYQLESVGGELGERKNRAALVEQIREIDTESYVAVVGMMAHLVEEGHYKVHTGTCKPGPVSGTIFLYDKIYLSCRNGDGQASSWLRALEAETRKMTDAHKKSRAAKVKSGNPKLDQFVKASYADSYTFYSPSRTVPAQNERPERRVPEGWALVRLENTNKGERGKKANWVIDILDAVGSCVWLVRGDGKKRMPHFWFLEGRPMPGRDHWIEEEVFKRTKSKIGALRAMVWAWLDEQGDKEKTESVRELLNAGKNKAARKGNKKS